MPTPEYLRRLTKCYRLGLIDKGCIGVADVYHESACSSLREEMPEACDCDCDIEITVKGGATFAVTESGRLALCSGPRQTSKDAL